MSSRPATKRSYVLRSYISCTRHDRRREYVYYACRINRDQHRDQPWYDEHPSTLTVRESLMLPIVGTFFAELILGPGRAAFLTPTAAPTDPADQERRILHQRLDQLSRAQQNLIAQIETFQPTGNDKTDTEWHVNLQRRFAALSTNAEQPATPRTLSTPEPTHRGSNHPTPTTCSPRYP